MATYVIGDVHGCYFSMISLFEKLDLSKDDEIIFLGDLINKGHYSKKVVDQVIEWRRLGWNIVVIRGNHEQKLLSLNGISSEEEIKSFKKNFYGKNSYNEFFQDNFELEEEYFEFFSSTKYYLLSGEYLMVHAGFNCQENRAFTDKKAMLYIRNWKAHYDREMLQGCTVVHGHQSVSRKEVRQALNAPIIETIPLDTGCVYFGEKKGRGYLSALRLDDLKLYEQMNLDNWLFN